MTTARNPQDVHLPVANYVHQIEIGPGGRWLVLSGQIGIRPDGSLPPDPAEQIAVALENLRRNLAAAEMDVTNVVKLTTYLVGDVDAQARAAAFGAFLGAHTPTQTLLYVARLAAPTLRVEIEAWAHADS